MDPREFYQQVILQHARRPRNFGPLSEATVNGRGDNPLCGDEIALHLQIDGDRVKQAQFTGQACAICTASASIMTDAIRGQSLADCHQLIEEFAALCASGSPAEPSRLPVAAHALGGVHQFPQRIKCAMLPWRVLGGALDPPE